MAIGGYESLLACIIIAGMHEEDCNAHNVIILGNQVMPDGTPSARLKARLKARLNRIPHLHQVNRFELIVVPGGIDSSRTDVSICLNNIAEFHGQPVALLHHLPSLRSGRAKWDVKSANHSA